MSQQSATFEVSNPVARIHHAIRSVAPYVPIVLSMLALFALVTYAIIGVAVYAVPLARFTPAPAFGLMPYNAAGTVPAVSSQAAFLAANPEVPHVVNHTSATATRIFVDANPELRLFLNHAGSVQAAEDAFFAANPEAGTMLRFAATQGH